LYIGIYTGFYNGGGSRGGGRVRSMGDGSPAVGFMGKAPIGGLGDELPQKLKQNVKLLYNLLTFFCRIFRI